MRSIVYAAMALALAVSFGGAAHANSRFTVKNNSGTWGDSIEVSVFNGYDGGCSVKAKSFTVKRGKEKSASCIAIGKQRCKIMVAEKSGPYVRYKTCPKLRNTCDGTAIKIENKKTLIVGSEGCSIQ